jgi:hypothetical protein
MFALRGSLGFYSDHSSLIHFQPELLRALIGGNWLLLCVLTGAVALNKAIIPEVKWPLVGLGATNCLLMLGDIMVPAKAILLSHHASHFIQTSMAVLLTFLVSAVVTRERWRTSRSNWIVGCATGGVIATGILLSVGNYRGALPFNEQGAELSEIFSGSAKPDSGELVIARSKNVDDTCSWIFVLTGNPVLYCTDAEIMLTPQQNTDIHRFRQAIYLYLAGRDSTWLHHALTGPRRLDVMHELGFWAEAASLSPAEQEDGFREIESQLTPLLMQVERGDPAIRKFFKQFPRVVVIDSLENPTFSQQRVATLLRIEGEKTSRTLKVSTYSPRTQDEPLPALTRSIPSQTQ